MASPSIKFKKLLLSNDKDNRAKILQPLMQYMMNQIAHDTNAAACYNSLQEAHQVNSWSETKEFKEHHLWHMMSNHDSCESFLEIVKSKLAVPKKTVLSPIKHVSTVSRKSIPKKIRGEAWNKQFGDSTKGSCYCCKTILDAFSDWHAGHIVAHANGGSDTADNIRPLCGSCNTSMGTDNMDEFKSRYYP